MAAQPSFGLLSSHVTALVEHPGSRFQSLSHAIAWDLGEGGKEEATRQETTGTDRAKSAKRAHLHPIATSSLFSSSSSLREPHLTAGISLC